MSLDDLKFEIVPHDWQTCLGWSLWMAGILTCYELAGLSWEYRFEEAVKMASTLLPTPIYRVSGSPAAVAEIQDRIEQARRRKNQT